MIRVAVACIMYVVVSACGDPNATPDGPLAPVENILRPVITHDSLFVRTSETRQIEVVVYDRANQPVPSSSVRPVWTSRQDEIARVDAAGAVTGVAAGVATLVVSLGNERDSVLVFVTPFATIRRTLAFEASVPAQVRDLVALVQSPIASAAPTGSLQTPIDSAGRVLVLAVNAAGNVVFVSHARGREPALELGPTQTAISLVRLALHPAITGVEASEDMVKIAENSSAFGSLVDAVLAAAATSDGLPASAHVRSALDATVALALQNQRQRMLETATRYEGECVGPTVDLIGVPVAVRDIPDGTHRLCLLNRSLVAWAYAIAPPEPREGILLAREPRLFEAIRPDPPEPSATAVNARVGSLHFMIGQNDQSRLTNSALIVVDLLSFALNSLVPDDLSNGEQFAQCIGATASSDLFVRMVESAVHSGNPGVLLDAMLDWLVGVIETTQQCSLAREFDYTRLISPTYRRAVTAVLGILDVSLHRAPVWGELLAAWPAFMAERGTACQIADGRLFASRCGALDIVVVRDASSDQPEFEARVSLDGESTHAPIQIASNVSRMGVEDVAAVPYRVALVYPSSCAQAPNVTLVPQEQTISILPGQRSTVTFDGRCRIPPPQFSPSQLRFEREQGTRTADPQTVIVNWAGNVPDAVFRLGDVDYRGGRSGWLVRRELAQSQTPPQRAALTLDVDASELPPGDYSASLPVIVSVPTGTSTGVLTVTLKVTPALTGSISGTVRSPQRVGFTGVSVSDGTVTVQTDERESYRLTQRPVGSRTVNVSNLPQGCANPAAQSVSVVANETANADFIVNCNVTVSGVITSSTGTPLANITVTVNGQQTTTNALGEYTLTTSPPAGTTVSLSGLASNCMAPGTRSVTVPRDGVVRVDFTVTCSSRPQMAGNCSQTCPVVCGIAPVTFTQAPFGYPHPDRTEQVASVPKFYWPEAILHGVSIRGHLSGIADAPRVSPGGPYEIYLWSQLLFKVNDGYGWRYAEFGGILTEPRSGPFLFITLSPGGRWYNSSHLIGSAAGETIDASVHVGVKYLGSGNSVSATAEWTIVYDCSMR